MGNNISENKKPVDFQNIIDTIATYYILTMDFKNLSKLSEKEHCDKMLVLTSDIISKYFTLQQISFLEERVTNGQPIDTMEKDKVIYMTKEQLENLDVNVNKKQRVCLGIAKFYIIIAHVFSAIVMTINPTYTYVDDSGVAREYNIYEKDKIPKDATTTIQRLNICKNRIDSLQSGQDTLVDKASGNINVSPNICSINLMSDGNVKSLTDEPGIPELKQLYLDEDYDFATGKFKGMSDETKKQYKSDLKFFYKAFTGNDELPDDVNDFSDIKLKNYQADKNCLNNKFKSSYSGNIENSLFGNYANHIINMIQRANDKQSELLKVINILFTYVIDPVTGNKTIKIQPTLNDATLAMVVKDTRKIIIELYSQCERDYSKGVKLYEDIVDAIGSSTLITQEKNLNEALETVSVPFIPPRDDMSPFERVSSDSDTESELGSEFESELESDSDSESDVPHLEEPLIENNPFIIPDVSSPSTPTFTPNEDVLKMNELEPTPPLPLEEPVIENKPFIIPDPSTPTFTPNDDVLKMNDPEPLYNTETENETLVQQPNENEPLVQQPIINEPLVQQPPQPLPIINEPPQPLPIINEPPQPLPIINEPPQQLANMNPLNQPLYNYPPVQININGHKIQGGNKKRTRRKHKNYNKKRKTKKQNK